MTKIVASKSFFKKTPPSVNDANGVRSKKIPLRAHTEDALQKYFSELNGHKPGHLYDLVLGEVEEPLFKTLLVYTKGNQTVAAQILGINRATLRKKLQRYQLLD